MHRVVRICSDFKAYWVHTFDFPLNCGSVGLTLLFTLLNKTRIYDSKTCLYSYDLNKLQILKVRLNLQEAFQAFFMLLLALLLRSKQK